MNQWHIIKLTLLSFSSHDFLRSIKKQGKDRAKWGAAWNTAPFQSGLWCVMFFNETAHSHQNTLLSSTQTGKRAKERDRDCARAESADLCEHGRAKDWRAHHRHHGDQAKDREETTLAEFYWAFLLYKFSFHSLKMTEKNEIWNSVKLWLGNHHSPMMFVDKQNNGCACYFIY